MVSSSPANGLLRRVAVWVLAAWAAAMYGVTLLHLDADFPYRSPWSDWAKTTDEGWYGGGAVHAAVFGHWYLPDAFNPAVAMPVWPVMLGAWFRVAGFGMVQARLLTVLLYGASAVLLYVLLRQAKCSRVAAMGAVLLVVANPFCYAFDRLAVLEPVMVFWWLLALWIAGFAARRGGVWLAGTLGVVLAALVLTKATAVLLAVSVLYFLAASARRAGLGWMRPVGVAAGVMAGLWGAYYFGWVRPHYLADYRFLFAINADRIHLSIVPEYTLRLLHDGLWVSHVLFPVGLLAVVAAAVWLRGLWREPLFGAAVLAMGLYLGFILYHTNFQPRYFLVIAVPLVIVTAMGVERGLVLFPVAAWGVAGLLGVTAAAMTFATMGYALRPAYVFRDTAREVAAVMRADGGASAVLWSQSGDDFSLFTGMRGVALYQPNGTDALIGRYQPGYAALWLDWEAPQLARISERYRLEPVRVFRVYDDEARHQALVLYRMHPR